jgi:hypothetical protein
MLIAATSPVDERGRDGRLSLKESKTENRVRPQQRDLRLFLIFETRVGVRDRSI